MRKEVEPVKVINKQTGKIRWFAPHLAHDVKYMNQVGYMLSEVEEIKPLPIQEIKEVVEDIVDEFLEDSKPKKGRKPNNSKLN